MKADVYEGMSTVQQHNISNDRADAFSKPTFIKSVSPPGRDRTEWRVVVLYGALKVTSG